jgi:hypothetical protein
VVSTQSTTRYRIALFFFFFFFQAGTFASIFDEQTCNQEDNINELRIPNCADVGGVEPAVKNRMDG